MRITHSVQAEGLKDGLLVHAEASRGEGESPNRSPSPTRKKRAAYADSLILTILKFQCFAAYIRNSLISRSISSAGLQKRRRVWPRPCTFRARCRGWRPG